MMLALIIALAACSGNPSSSLSSNNKQTTSQKLVVYVLGWGEHLSQGDAIRNAGYGYANTFYIQGGINHTCKEKRTPME